MATCRISESEGLAFLEADLRWFLWEIDDFIMVNSFSQTGVWSDDEPLTLVPEKEILLSSAIVRSKDQHFLGLFLSLIGVLPIYTG